MKQIPLTGKHGIGKFALVDNEDFDRVNQYRWWLWKVGNDYYPTGWIGNKNIPLHQFITGAKNVDHRNGNTLDSQRLNLRICTHQQNCCNRKKCSISSRSQYKGVRWSTQMKKWQSYITSKGKSIYLGSFEEEINAAQAYNDAATVHHGEFARLNLIGE